MRCNWLSSLHNCLIHRLPDVNLYDIAYSLGLGISAPFWFLRAKSRAKVLGALRTRLGDIAERAIGAPAIMIHAVSVGEINATKALIDQLRKEKPTLAFIVSTTTQTGYERGATLYGNSADVTLIRYPLDFSHAINRVLTRSKPGLVVLMELELWPNFILQCEKRQIPLVLANGRITEPSYRSYHRFKRVTSSMFRRLAVVCAQDQTYAERFIDLGVPRDRVTVAGTMKFDTAVVAERVEGDDALARDVGLRRGDDLIWICGSTGPGEEQVVLDVYGELKKQFPTLRLAIIPRHPPRFDEVAEMIRHRGLPLVRRSAPETWNIVSSDAVVLGDTMGELRKFYSLAGVVFVGRSLVDLGHRQHGSDMIEPAALAKPVIVGPYTTNFADAMLKFKTAEAMLEVTTADALLQALRSLLADEKERLALGTKAQRVVREQQGSTLRHAAIILNVLANSSRDQ